MRIVDEITGFESRIEALRQKSWLQIEKRADSAYILQPKAAIEGPKPISLTLMAIVHGNEVAGTTILNQVLDAILSETIILRQPLAVVLGNCAAAAQGKRYLERDLNRSFNRPDAGDAESKRAVQLSSILDETHLLLDIHQTKEPAENPFFIFPYSKSGLALARNISMDIPVVTHWGTPFSSEGMCTDEYTNTKGGCGITLEVGQNGFHPFRVGTGVHAVLKTLAFSQRCWDEGSLPNWTPTDENLNAFGFSDIVPYPTNGSVHLEDGLHNFTPVSKGQVLGQINGQDFSAEQDGLILFPQYMRHGETNRPAELFRLLSPLKVNQLPKD
ncbi:succinylglutamate desuccinylase/aspartoacylase family protein [Oligoflexaceae bacterium]|nr:succinylglutamate desuccinylase/aspartoacylase family protein [Oligoflexaceae bacterium]